MTKLTKKDLLETRNPIILLYGNDMFSIEEFLLKLLKKLIRDENDKMEYEYLDAEDQECTQYKVAEVASQISMLTDNKTVVVKRFNKLFDKRRKGNIAKSLIDYFENPNPNTNLILIAHIENEKLDFNSNPYKLLQHCALEFKTPYENQLPFWVKNRFADNGVEITMEAADFIVMQTESNLHILASEIEKILLFYINKKNINLEDILVVSGNSRKYTVFDLIKSVGNKSKEQAISIMNNILTVSSQEILLITLLRDFFIKIWKLQELIQQGFLDKTELSKKIGLRNAYFFYDYSNASKLYNPLEIEKIFIILTEADTKLKTTSESSISIIEQMLVKIMN